MNRNSLFKYIQLAIGIVLSVCLLSCNNGLLEKDPKDVVVGLQPYGDFPREMMDSISKALTDVYGFQVKVLEAKKLPESAFVTIKSPRYRADTILDVQERNFPDGIDFMLGLTTRDISTTVYDDDGNIQEPKYKYEDWGIFGLGSRPGPTCVVSIFRFVNKKNFYDRLMKICVHEIGHNIGLDHCESEHCVMRDANEKITTIDDEKMELCDNCRQSL